MPASGVAIIGGEVGAGLIGAQQSSAAMAAAQAARQKALQEYLDVNVPNPADQQAILQKYSVTGQLDPKMEQAVSQRASELQNMPANSQGRSAEISALEQMRDVSESGGMDAQARQQMMQGIQTANTNERGQIGAIVQNANARGVGGSGAQLAAELQSTQNDANSSADAGMTAASGAQQRALMAMQTEGQLGSNLNQQDYAQAAQKAEAQDAINRFNTQNQQATSNANVTASNQAQASNLANQQAVSNSNVGIGNQQEMYNKGLVQQQFNNQMTKAAGEANALNGVAAGEQYQGQTAANEWSNIGNAVGQGVAAIAKNANNKNSTNSDSVLDLSDNSDNSNSSTPYV